MSKATDADATSATTDEGKDSEGIVSNGSSDRTDAPSVDTEPSVEPQGTARALTVRTEGNRSPLYGTDRAMARKLIEKAEYHKNTDISEVRLERYGETLNVHLKGRIVLSYSDVERVVDDTYETFDLLSHSSGGVTVTLTTR